MIHNCENFGPNPYKFCIKYKDGKFGVWRENKLFIKHQTYFYNYL